MVTIKIKNAVLIELRVKKGLSMNELAKKINVNVGVISKIESCSVNPRPKTAQKICDCLEVPFDKIFEIVQE